MAAQGGGDSLQDIFKLFDIDGSGAIDLRELGTIMRSFGANPSEQDLQDIMARVDEDGSGTMEFSEFVMLMAREMPNSMLAAHVAELQEAFTLFDLDGSGAIDLVELGTVMRSLGSNPSQEELQSIVSRVDEDGSGNIEFPEFVLMMANVMQSPQQANTELREAFHVFDENNSGFISSASLRHIITGMADNLDEDEVEEIVRMVDADGDGRISFQRFLDLMTMGLLRGKSERADQ